MWLPASDTMLEHILSNMAKVQVFAIAQDTLDKQECLNNMVYVHETAEVFEVYLVNENILLISTIVLVAMITSVIFVLQVQRHRFKMFSAHLVEWENARKRSLQIWEMQQEKRAIELENSLSTPVQRVAKAWKAWEVNDTSLVTSIAQQSNTLLHHTELEHEIVRLPFVDEIPLKNFD